jgi:hypothetical protein
MPDYGQYGKYFWNNKYKMSPVIYSGRAERGRSTNINVDVRNFIVNNDYILQQVVAKYGLKKDTPNNTAWAVQQFVVKFLSYMEDDKANLAEEFWQFPFEAIQWGVGDCEDGALLTASLMINAGIESWRVKSAAGYVQESATAPQGGHCYCLFLADRPESERKLEWVIMDWCYLEDSRLPPEKKPLAKDGGQQNNYKDTWFTFNDQFSWAGGPISMQDSRVTSAVAAAQDNQLAEQLTNELLPQIFNEIDKKYKRGQSIY